MISAIGTYLPRWAQSSRRVVGDDEDVVTMAVAAGRSALALTDLKVDRFVLVTREFPLLEGGNTAPLLAGLGLPLTTETHEELGGGPAALDAICAARPGTMVVGADVDPDPGAVAVVVGTHGVAVASGGRVSHSLPVRTRDATGFTTDYADPRLLREQGVRASLERLAVVGDVAAVAGLSARDATALLEGKPDSYPSGGAAAALLALADVAERGEGGTVVVVQQATASAARLEQGPVAVARDEHPPLAVPATKMGSQADIAISLAAYDRAFEPKLRLEADRCRVCGTLAYPRRFRCLECGAERSGEPEALPRQARVYTMATIHTPVPGLATPFTLTLVQLDDSEVRFLVRLTGAPPGSVGIGDGGTLVLRRVAVRSGVPDYGYAFLPDDKPR